MFPVAKLDNQLNNKAEVLVIRTPQYTEDPLAISIQYLKKKGIYQDQIKGNAFVVIAEKDGWSRVYHSYNVKFKQYKKGKLKDENGNTWTISESHITGPNGEKLLRIPAHNSFWFAWYNAYPNTRLVK